jgi:hypothetical protein
MPPGAYAPPLVVQRCGHLPTKLRLVRYTNARLQERRASARRGSVTHRACRVQRTMFGEHRLPNQERRTVSPPWFGNVTFLRTGSADRQPHPYVRLGAAGVTPPGYGNVSRLQSAAKNVRRTPTAASRAAGVSPPWFGSRTGNGDRLSWSDFVHHSRSCGTPRLAHASCSRRRSWWTHANRRKCAASLCTGESFHSHGWITPAAPGARSRSAEK